jgi:hypothetical protein
LRALLQNYMRNAAEPEDINRLQELTVNESDGRWYRDLDPRPCASLTKEEVAVLRPKAQAVIARSGPGTVIVKTHNALVADRGTPMISEELTAGAIYILRNPLDIAVSYAAHYGLSLDDAVAAMNRTHNQSASNEPAFVYELHGSWSENVESWTRQDTAAIRVVRYEDLRRDTAAIFGGLVRFLGMPENPGRLQRAIQNSAIEVLQAQELKHGFRERSRKSDKFFRAGRIGEGRERLPPALVDSLLRHHEGQMRRFGYWPAESPR